MPNTKVLIVDDDPLLLNEISELLDARGHRVIGALDGVEAIRLVLSEQPDIVIADVILPESDGIEVARRTREILPTAKIIVISGSGRLRTPALWPLAEHFGADSVLYKPFRSVTLLRTIDALTASSSQNSTGNVMSLVAS